MSRAIRDEDEPGVVLDQLSKRDAECLGVADMTGAQLRARVFQLEGLVGELHDALNLMVLRPPGMSRGEIESRAQEALATSRERYQPRYLEALDLMRSTVTKSGGPKKWKTLKAAMYRTCRARDRVGIADFARRCTRHDDGAVQLAMLALLGLTLTSEILALEKTDAGMH